MLVIYISIKFSLSIIQPFTVGIANRLVLS